MLKLVSIPLILAGLGLQAQDSGAAKKFIGEWNARFKGKVICTIRLTPGDPISGQSEDCNINVDANGDLQEPDPANQPGEPSPILKPKVQGSTLSFEEEEGGDTIRFEFTIVGDGKAELKIVDAPVAVKPIPFSRR